VLEAGAIRTITNCAESNDADYRKKNSPSHIRGLLDTKNTGIDRLTRLSDERWRRFWGWTRLAVVVMRLRRPGVSVRLRELSGVGRREVRRRCKTEKVDEKSF
jgi:hypothetical protein